MKFSESDMYAPIRDLLALQGFTVRGEVKGCDIAAVNGDALWIIEMKLSANLTLILQAMERKTATDWVFIAIPRPKSMRGSFNKLKKLVKKLQLGLITVALDSPAQHAEIIIFPDGKSEKNNKKTAVIKREIAGRTVDSTGGTTKTKVNTAYRERCVRIACLIAARGTSSAKELVAMGCERDASRIMYTNICGWFVNVSKGKYALSQAGQDYLAQHADTPLVAFYRMKAEVDT